MLPEVRPSFSAIPRAVIPRSEATRNLDRPKGSERARFFITFGMTG
jgi:hypothetical protein